MPIAVAPPSGLAETRRVGPSVSFGLGPSILGAVDPHLTPKRRRDTGRHQPTREDTGRLYSCCVRESVRHGLVRDVTRAPAEWTWITFARDRRRPPAPAPAFQSRSGQDPRPIVAGRGVVRRVGWCAAGSGRRELSPTMGCAAGWRVCRRAAPASRDGRPSWTDTRVGTADDRASNGHRARSAR